MRLLRSSPGGDGFTLSSFNANDPPPYAILSHTWSQGEEVIYDELVAGKGKNKAGYAKLRFCAERAAKDGLDYFWVDSCCINKQDNNELSTALNSMFRWYQRATKCYVYLSDVHVADEVTDIEEFRIAWESAFRRSRWFTRGWTLQELLAPASVEFFSANSKRLGSKISLEQEIHEVTQIPIRALRNYDLREFSVDERLGWVKDRRTTVEEDRVYCLLGIFGVFLPLIPGEGETYALQRLREEIQKRSGHVQSSDAISMQKICSSRLPFLRNQFFVGREDHLRTLEERLCPSRTHERMSIYGLGGGGKTAVALELAYRIMEKHPQCLVLWVPAISQETFEIAYREIGALLCIPGITDENANVKQLVMHGLDSGRFGDWMMIVDNADDLSILLDRRNDGLNSGRLYDYLPRSNQGSILFTTRGRKAAERLAPSNILELGDMSKAEAKQLMAQRISSKELLDDQSAVNKLLELLTYLPLAIVQAVAFINSNHVSIADYVSLFKETDMEIEVFSERFNDPSRYQETENTIAKTWQISFDQILTQNRLAANYLSFMACVDRVNIPLSLLPMESTPMQRMKAIGTLIGYAFISERRRDSPRPEEERFFDVHRLVQKATVWWLKEHGDWIAWTETAYNRLEELVPYGGHEGRTKWMSYLPHAMHVSELHIGSSETGRAALLDRVGRCQTTLGQYAAAEAIHRRVLSFRRKKLGNEDPSTLTSMNQVGLALDDQGRYEEGERMHRQTLALSEKVLGKKHPSTLTSMNNLAEVLKRQGKYKEAETIHRQTLALKTKVLGKEHPDTLTGMDNLAGLLSEQGKDEEAETMLRQSLALIEKVLGKEHPDTLTNMNNLALVLNRQGKHEEAETKHSQTLVLREKILGKEHPDTLTNMNNLADVLNRQGKYKEAETMHRQTLALKEKVLGKEHPSTLTSIGNLALVLSRQGRYEEAETMHRHTLALREKVLSMEHPDTLTSMNNLALVMSRQGKYKEAKAMHTETLALSEKVLSKDHPDTLMSMHNVAEVLNRQGKYKEAETMHKQTLALRERVLGKDHPDVLLSMYCVAHSLTNQSLYTEATSFYQKACKGYSVVLGDDHPTASACLRDYLEMLKRKERSELRAINEPQRSMPSNKESVVEDGSRSSQMPKKSRLSRSLAKLNIRASRYEK